ncbi:hypothetical protein BU14_0077s0026 [Porphyra umbilicalis]|uniref:Uncharacterized protein n=1 Tax=Porphyra umbilicalis TaxID=2786 RepID=A0A1X6PF92_PORUM|nr:hypothetical protein BU14_0077s0026 [Porphyra umbilicalis]|eukprot:OSX79406.1 hypothetical protein BU14_0077s0026 [Porphyra umbilicalis]
MEAPTPPASLVPPTFAALHDAASASVVALLPTTPHMEVEVPAPGGLNATGDGSASSARAAAAASVAVAAAIAAAVTAAGRPAALLPGARRRQRRRRRQWQRGAPPPRVLARAADAAAASVVVAVSPAGTAAWDALAALVPTVAAVVIVNGHLCRGLAPWAPAYAVKPLSGRGWLVCAHPVPGGWALVDRWGVRVRGEVAVLTQGRLRRPDLAAAWQALLAGGG